MGVQINAQEILSREDIIAKLAETPADTDAIFLLPDIVTVAHIDAFKDVVIDMKIPLSAATISSVEGGALLTFGNDFYASGKQAARLAHQIIGGTNPGDLPVEQAEFFLYINLTTAEAIGLDIPDSILDQAEVIR
ncbi:MAG: hypothetical protein GY943_09820 [Chloroflexi bacterium]|nr:hypothetical protein [Chloroflexota bacterium]